MTDKNRLPVGFGRNYVMPVIHQYAAQWPDVDIDVNFSDDYGDPVQEGIDVAARIGGSDGSRPVRKIPALYRRISCASPGYPAVYAGQRNPAIPGYRADTAREDRCARCICQHISGAGSPRITQYTGNAMAGERGMGIPGHQP